MRYLLNAPVLTDYGEFLFEGPMSIKDARDFAVRGLYSAIGHKATARFLREHFGIGAKAKRTAVRMDPGDHALVLRIVERLPEGVVLTCRDLAERRHEFGLLTRTT